MNDYKENPVISSEEEITLKELILRVREYAEEVWMNWKLLILIPIPFITFFLIQAFTFSVTYTGQLTFMVNEDEGGGVGGAMAILSQFGLGAGSSSGKFNLDKILKLSTTRKLIQLSLFEKHIIEGEDNFLANHIIRIYSLHENWEESEIGLKDFFYSHGKVEEFNLAENAALKSIHNVIVGSEHTPGFYSTDLDEDTGIMTLTAKCRSPELSIAWLNSIYRNLSRYYIDKTIEKQENTYLVVKEKVDSIQLMLKTAEVRLARVRDSGRGLYTNKDRLEESRLMRDIQILTLMQGEAVKNQEIADFSLKTKTPFIQLIDAPIPPLSPRGKSKLRATIIGGLIGGLIAVAFILGRKIYIETMEE